MVSCRSCYVIAGSKCISCGATRARTERTYMSRCKKCMSALDLASHWAIVEEESLAYSEGPHQEQHADGTEPALQVLHLPIQNSTTLPPYARRPEYLSPEHCRLCLADCREGSSKGCHGTALSCPRNGTHDDANASSSWGVHPSVARHLSEAHNGMTPREYRSLVLGQTLRAWPEEVSPQVLRTRLAAYKEEMCDKNVRLGVCACCAREKLDRQ